jgi:hypothetical protein
MCDVTDELNTVKDRVNAKIREMSDVIACLSNEKDLMMTKLQEIESSLETSSEKVESMTMNRISAHVEELQSRISATKTSLTSLINNEIKSRQQVEGKCQSPSTSSSSPIRTLSCEFRTRFEELGLNYKLIEGLFENDGVYVSADVVAQTLLGEKWDVKHIPLFNLSGKHDTELKYLFNACGYSCSGGTVTQLGQFKKKSTWTVYRMEPYPIRKVSSPIVFWLYCSPQKVNRSAINDLFGMFDFVKTCYDGKSFYISKWNNFLMRTHNTTDNGLGYYPASGVGEPEFKTLGFKFEKTNMRDGEKIFTATSRVNPVRDLIAQERNRISKSSRDIRVSKVASQVLNSQPSSSSIQSLKDAFNARLEELGVDHELIRGVLDNPGMFVVGDVVTQALLGKKWDVKCIDIVNLTDKFKNELKCLFSKHGYDRSIDVLVGKGPVGKETKWLETTMTPLPTSRSKVEIRMFRAHVDNSHVAIEDLLPFDFVKNYYDGIDFVVAKWKHFATKTHVGATQPGHYILAKVEANCYRHAGFNFVSSSDIAVEKKTIDASQCTDYLQYLIINTRQELSSSQKSIRSSTPSQSSAPTVTLGEAFEKKIADLGLDLEFFEEFFANGGIVMGEIVTQVLLGEDWKSDCDRTFIKLASHNRERNEPVLEMLRRWVGNVYVPKKCPAFHGSYQWYAFMMGDCDIHVYLKGDETKDDEFAHDLLEFDFLKNSYNGKTFVVKKPISLRDRCQYTDDKDSKIVSVYANSGFTFKVGKPPADSSAVFLPNETSKYVKDVLSSVPPTAEKKDDLKLGDAFKKKVSAIGLDIGFFEKLFENGGFVMGDIVTQTLLDEDWGEERPVIKLASHKQAANERIKILQMLVNWYGTPTEYPMGLFRQYRFEAIKCVFILYLPSGDIKEDECAHDLLQFDFLKNSYDGNVFVVKKYSSFRNRCHTGLDIDNIGRYAKFGFTCKTEAPVSERHFVFFPGATTDEVKMIMSSNVVNSALSTSTSTPSISSTSTPSTSTPSSSNVVNSALSTSTSTPSTSSTSTPSTSSTSTPSTSSTSTPSTSSTSNPSTLSIPTLGDVVMERIGELGVDLEIIEKIFSCDGTFIGGDIVLQVLLGEKWDVKSLDAFSLQCGIANKYPTLLTEGVKRAPELTRVGDWTMSTNDACWSPVPLHLYTPTLHPTGSTPEEKTKNVAEKIIPKLKTVYPLDFCNVYFDGKKFLIFDEGAVVGKRHSSDVETIPKELIDEYTALGFTIPNTNPAKSNTEFVASLPFNHFSKKSNRIAVEVVKKMPKMAEQLKTILKRVVAHYNVDMGIIDGLLSAGLGTLVGSVITQTINGELWSNARAITILEKYPHSLDAFLEHHKFTKSQRDSVTFFTKDSAMIRVVTPAFLANLFQFCDGEYDGKQFIIRHKSMADDKTHIFYSGQPLASPIRMRKYELRGYRFVHKPELSPPESKQASFPATQYYQL